MATWYELVFPSATSNDTELVIEDDRADVVNDPLRWRILETLGEGKPVSAISEMLDVTDARILYHLQRLAETGVVTVKEADEDVDEDDAGEVDTGSSPREWRCLPAAGKIRVRSKPSAGKQSTSGPALNDQAAGDHATNDQTLREQSASEPTGEAIPPDVADQFNQALREAAEGLYGSTFQVSVNHNRARLSEAQAAEFNRRLLALIEYYFPPGKGDQSGIKYGFHGVLTPIDLHPIEESGIEE